MGHPLRLLRDGTPRVTKTSLKEKYGSNKLAVVEQTLPRPHVLAKYKNDKDQAMTPPLEHEALAEIENTPAPDWDSLARDLRAMPTGREHANDYEDLIERLLSALFYPSLTHPQKQHRIHAGRKRIDITYTNEARSGFFTWVARNYRAPYVFVECKNFETEVGNPELDQLAGRFSPQRGQVGLLVCRSVDNMDRLTAGCRDTALDGRGFLVVLTDADVETLIEEARSLDRRHEFQLLRAKFGALIN